MKRNSKKKFRGTPEQHGQAAARSLKFAREAIRDARKDLRSGPGSYVECSNALQNILSAKGEIGHYITERNWRGRRGTASTPRQRTPQYRVTEQLKDVVVLFTRACMR